MRVFRYLFLSLLFLHVALFSCAQIVRIDLPKNLYAFEIVEDAQQVIWVGLSDGDSDGKLGFIRNDSLVYLDENPTLPLGAFQTSIQLPDSSLLLAGHIHVDGKPCLVHINHGQVDTISLPTSHSKQSVTTIRVVNGSELWLGTTNGVLVRRAGEWLHYTVRDGLPHAIVNAIEEDFRGVVWVGTDLGLARYMDGKFHAIEPSSRAISSVSHLFSDAKGYLWAGSRFSSEGVSVYNGQVWETFSVRHGLEDNSSSFFFQDSKQNIWVGSCYHRSRGGLSVFNGNQWKGLSFPKTLAKSCIDAITEDVYGNIWVGGSVSSRKGKGISVFNGNTWRYICPTPDLPLDRVMTFFSDSQGRLWISTTNGLFIIYPDDIRTILAQQNE